MSHGWAVRWWLSGNSNNCRWHDVVGAGCVLHTLLKGRERFASAIRDLSVLGLTLECAPRFSVVL